MAIADLANLACGPDADNTASAGGVEVHANYASIARHCQKVITESEVSGLDRAIRIMPQSDIQTRFFHYRVERKK